MNDDDLNTDDLEAIEELLRGITPGPWYPIHADDRMAMNCYAVATTPDARPHDPSDCGLFVAGCLVQSEVPIVPANGCHAANTAFIALAPQLVEKLVQEIRQRNQWLARFTNDSEAYLLGAENTKKQYAALLAAARALQQARMKISQTSEADSTGVHDACNEEFLAINRVITAVKDLENSDTPHE